MLGKAGKAYQGQTHYFIWFIRKILRKEFYNLGHQIEMKLISYQNKLKIKSLALHQSYINRVDTIDETWWTEKRPRVTSPP